MALTIVPFRCRADNYGVLLHDDAANATATVDAPDAATVAAELARHGWGLDLILTTHSHEDHVAGNLALKAAFGCIIVGPAGEARDIPGIDRAVDGGATLLFAGRKVEVIATPGHTPGHVSYRLPGEETVFVGDTLFTMGCGRVAEGWAPVLWQSLDRLRNLPDKTRVYCGHDYAAANARFALTVDPENPELAARAAEAAAVEAANGLNPPTTIALERRTNPFLRVDSPAIRTALAMATEPPSDVFAELRRRKDRF